MFGTSEFIVCLWFLPLTLFFIVPLALLVMHIITTTVRSVVSTIAGKYETR